MTTADLTAPQFTNEKAAMEHLEASRWPDGPFCGYCGSFNVTRMGGKTQAGYFNCNDCRQKFTARVGTVLERSKVPVHKWLLAIHLLTSSKKGMSAHQLHRMLGVTYKTAWFMAHRIREAMAEKATDRGPIGGEGKTVEADETYFGPKDRVTKRTKKGKPTHSQKRMVVGLVERGGHTRLFYVERGTTETLREVLVRNASRKSDLYTDESNLYPITGGEFASHRTVKHTAGEYVRYDGDTVIHTNTIENVFSVLKRGMRGTYQHCGEAHLHRYLAEFEFRYNNRSALGIEDLERAAKALKGIEGKRLTYRRIGEAANA